MIVVQAAPKTQPGGVHGALLSCKYHSFSAGFDPIKKEPNANAPKLSKRKRKKVSDLFITLIQSICDCFLKLNIK